MNWRSGRKEGGRRRRPSVCGSLKGRGTSESADSWRFNLDTNFMLGN